MKTLHDEAFYERALQPDEVDYAVKKVAEIIDMLESDASGKS